VIARRSRAILMVGAVFLAAASASAQTELVTLRVAVPPAAEMRAALYAQSSGMFRRNGLDVQFDFGVANGAAAAAAVASGTYDIGKTSIAGLIAAHVRGVPFVCVAAGEVYDRGNPFAGLIVASEGPIRSAKDLAQATVALSSLRDIGQLALTKALDDAGAPLGAVQYVELPMPAAPEAVARGRVQAAEMQQPQLQVALDSGAVRLLPIFDALGSGFIITAWYTTKDDVAQKGRAIRAFSRVMFEAARYTNGHAAQTAQMLADFNKVPVATVLRMPPPQSGTGVWAAGIQPLIDAELRYGYIAHGFSAHELIEPSVETRDAGVTGRPAAQEAPGRPGHSLAAG